MTSPLRTDPTGLRYGRADTEPAPAPVPDGVELRYLGNRQLPEPPTAEDMGLAGDPVAALLPLIDALSPTDRERLLDYYRSWPRRGLRAVA